MRLDRVLIALMFCIVATIATAKDFVTNTARKSADDATRNSPREPKVNIDEWQPYFYWHRDAMAAKNRNDNPIGRAPAVQL